MNDLQIEYFLAVAQNLSFTKTAAEKYVSQPAVSRQIAAMEEEIGVTLFERSYKSIVLTEAGALLADFYRKQRQDLTRITRQAREMHAHKPIPLNLACGGGWTLADFLPGILQTLRRDHPAIRISLESYNFHRLAVALNEGEADLVFTLATSLQALPSLHIHPLAEVPRAILYAGVHPLAEREGLQPEDFRQERFFVPAPDEASFIVDLVKSFCEPYGFVPKIEPVKSIESLLISVINGLGVAITDLWTFNNTLARQGDLRKVELNTNHSIVVAWRKGNNNPALPIFLEELSKVFYPEGDCPFAPDRPQTR